MPSPAKTAGRPCWRRWSEGTYSWFRSTTGVGGIAITTFFAGVLHARLQDEQPAAIPAPHRRASEWYEQHGERPEAIRHALVAEDFPRAATLLAVVFIARQRARVAVRTD